MSNLLGSGTNETLMVSASKASSPSPGASESLTRWRVGGAHLYSGVNGSKVDGAVCLTRLFPGNLFGAVTILNLAEPQNTPGTQTRTQRAKMKGMVLILHKWQGGCWAAPAPNLNPMNMHDYYVNKTKPESEML